CEFAVLSWPCAAPCLIHFKGGYRTDDQRVVQRLLPHDCDLLPCGGGAEGHRPTARAAFADRIIFIEQYFFYFLHSNPIRGDVLNIALRIIFHVPGDDSINHTLLEAG